jgi:hypothetical protein
MRRWRAARIAPRASSRPGVAAGAAWRWRQVARASISGGREAAVRLMPKPTITLSGRSPRRLASTRTPATFRSRRVRSLGHLMRRGAPCTEGARASWSASPTTSASGGSWAAVSAGRRSTDARRAEPRGATQGRPWRPRPRDCSSATKVVPSGAPSAAALRARSWVEGVSSTWWIAPLQVQPSARARRAASSGSKLIGRGPGPGRCPRRGPSASAPPR